MLHKLDELTKELKGHELEVYRSPSGDRRSAALALIDRAWAEIMSADRRIEQGKDVYRNIDRIRELINQITKL